MNKLQYKRIYDCIKISDEAVSGLKARLHAPQKRSGFKIFRAVPAMLIAIVMGISVSAAVVSSKDKVEGIATKISKLYSDRADHYALETSEKLKPYFSDGMIERMNSFTPFAVEAKTKITDYSKFNPQNPKTHLAHPSDNPPDISVLYLDRIDNIVFSVIEYKFQKPIIEESELDRTNVEAFTDYHQVINNVNCSNGVTTSMLDDDLKTVYTITTWELLDENSETLDLYFNLYFNPTFEESRKIHSLSEWEDNLSDSAKSVNFTECKFTIPLPESRAGETKTIKTDGKFESPVISLDYTDLTMSEVSFTVNYDVILSKEHVEAVNERILKTMALAQSNTQVRVPYFYRDANYYYEGYLKAAYAENPIPEHVKLYDSEGNVLLETKGNAPSFRRPADDSELIQKGSITLNLPYPIDWSTISYIELYPEGDYNCTRTPVTLYLS